MSQHHQHERDGEVGAHQHDRKADSLPYAVGRIVLALGAMAASAGAGGWYAKEKTVADDVQHHVIDAQARHDVQLLKTEIGGELKLIRQQLDHIIETQRDMKARGR